MEVALIHFLRLDRLVVVQLAYLEHAKARLYSLMLVELMLYDGGRKSA